MPSATPTQSPESRPNFVEESLYEVHQKVHPRGRQRYLRHLALGAGLVYPTDLLRAVLVCHGTGGKRCCSTWSSASSTFFGLVFLAAGRDLPGDPADHFGLFPVPVSPPSAAACGAAMLVRRRSTRKIFTWIEQKIEGERKCAHQTRCGAP
jgi:hypothetical protein